MPISGKTGTAQVGYGTEKVDYISSFVGYFPSDKPKYSCIVVINKPNKEVGYYGSDVAAPVFKRIAEKISSRFPNIEKHKLLEMNTPVLVRDEAMLGTGQLPKFADDSYKTTDGRWLIPTSEVTLTNTVASTIVNEEDLPIRMTSHSLCFRSEAGSAGRDTTGMLRQHQFEKVEMVSIAHPDESRTELDRMTRCAESILEALNLSYRTVVLCTGDMGASAKRTHDIEVWLPGQGQYREISSCSTCGDFQARRMNARFKPIESKKLEFVHTLNGSGLAVGRCLIAVLENGQQEDGSIKLPEVLSTYLGGKSKIDSNGELG